MVGEVGGGVFPSSSLSSLCWKKKTVADAGLGGPYDRYQISSRRYVCRSHDWWIEISV